MGTIPKLEDCNPGFFPVEYNVIVAAEESEEKTKGGIILPEAKKDADEISTVRGLLVDVSPLAFNFDHWPQDKADMRPKPGDHIIYAKYAGILLEGNDGRTYRLCKDKDVCAVITDANAAVRVIRRAA